MKEKKKVKRLKRILPFICAILLLLGGSITVFAMSFPDGYNGGKYVIYEYSDKYYFLETLDDVNVYVYESTNALYVRGILTSYTLWVCESSSLNDWSVYKSVVDETFGDKLATDITVIKSTFDIYLTNLGGDTSLGVFFSPMPITEMAKPLTEVVQNQTAMILPIAVGCLALLIGSTILVKKLRIFL